MTERTTDRSGSDERSDARRDDQKATFETVPVLAGMFTALGVLVFVGSLLIAGRGEIGFQLNAIDIDGNLQEVEAIAGLAAILVVLVSFVAGGWVAGKMAASDPAMNGLGSGLVFVALVALFAVLGEFVDPDLNAFAQADLPNWYAQLGADDMTLKTFAGAAAGVVASLLGGYVGGSIAERT